MNSRLALPALGAALGLSLSGAARADCRLALVAQIPARMEAGNIVTDATLDGRAVKFDVSTAAVSLLTRAAATRLNLKTINANGGNLYGIGGAMRVEVDRVETLKIGSLILRHLPFRVGDTRADVDKAVVGRIGIELFAHGDVEFDLAHNAIRLFRPTGCASAQMPYWGGAYWQTPLDRLSQTGTNVALKVSLDGKTVDAILDTSAPATMVSLGVARNLGVTPGSAGVERAGVLETRPGQPTRPIWLGTFASFALGGEQISPARLAISDWAQPIPVQAVGTRLAVIGWQAQVMVGADFFASHRILISRSQRTVYFSYNGGPVFQLGAAQVLLSAAFEEAKADPDRAIADYSEAFALDPMLWRALAGRSLVNDQKGDWAAALADAEAWAKLRPDDAHAANTACWDRGVLGTDLDKALADCDRALRLAPHEPDALDSRAFVLLKRGQAQAAVADEDAALAISPKRAELLFVRGVAEERLGRTDAARSDLAAARALDASIAARYAKMGLTP